VRYSALFCMLWVSDGSWWCGGDSLVECSAARHLYEKSGYILSGDSGDPVHDSLYRLPPHLTRIPDKDRCLYSCISLHGVLLELPPQIDSSVRMCAHITAHIGWLVQVCSPERERAGRRHAAVPAPAQAAAGPIAPCCGQGCYETASGDETASGGLWQRVPQAQGSQTSKAF
jgi:hypothetical protein